MSAWNTTVQNYSPLITYLPANAWTVGSNVSIPNPSFYDYVNDDYTTTNVTNATASFVFNGTGIWVYGSKGRDHGKYTVLLDGQASVFNGTSIPPFQTLLFGADHLSAGQHTLQIINTETNPNLSNLDVNSITWEQSRPDDTLLQQMIKVTAPNNWAYGPSWSLEQTSQVHEQQLLSNLPDSTVTLTFSGSHIDIYGSTNAECGSFVASIDGDNGGGPFSCYTPTNHSRVLLYSTDTGGLGGHNLTITSKEDQGRSGLVLSYAVVTTGIKFKDITPPLSGSAGSQSGASNARLALIITFSTLSPLLALFLLYLLLLRRKRIDRIRPDKEGKPQLDEEPDQTNGMLIMPYGRRGIPLDPSHLSSWADGKRVDRLPHLDALGGSIGQERRQAYKQEQPPQSQALERPRSGGLTWSKISPSQMSSQAVAGRTRHLGTVNDHTRAMRVAVVPKLVIPSDTGPTTVHEYTRGSVLEEYGFGRARSSPVTPPFAPQTMTPPPFPRFLPPPRPTWDAGKGWKEKNRRLSHPPPPAYEQAVASSMNNST